jgi:hypothetical protein
LAKAGKEHPLLVLRTAFVDAMANSLELIVDWFQMVHILLYFIRVINCVTDYLVSQQHVMKVNLASEFLCATF